VELTSVDALDHTVIVFGIVRPCRHRLSGTLFSDWMAHLCGLCLTLRELHGQAARLVTNYDAVLISVLVEAQRPSLVSHRSAGPCPFRKLQCAEVVDATAPGARLAAAASLILAAGKIRDHINDRDGAYARLLVAASSGLVAKRMQAGGERTGKAVGFDTTVLTSAINRQTEIERSTGLDLVEVTEPTETAVSATFAHTAVLAGQPYNYRPLAEIGRQFGRIAHLLDAVEDLPADRLKGSYNPLLSTATSVPRACEICAQALDTLRISISNLDMTRPALTHSLLGGEVGIAVDKAFKAAKRAAVTSNRHFRVLRSGESLTSGGSNFYLGCCADGLDDC
jgi:hypothetical protein